MHGRLNRRDRHLSRCFSVEFGQFSIHAQSMKRSLSDVVKDSHG